MTASGAIAEADIFRPDLKLAHTQARAEPQRCGERESRCVLCCMDLMPLFM